MKVSPLQKYVIKCRFLDPDGQKIGKMIAHVSISREKGSTIVTLYDRVVRQIQESGCAGAQPYYQLRRVNFRGFFEDEPYSASPSGPLLDPNSLPYAVEEDPRQTWWHRISVPYEVIRNGNLTGIVRTPSEQPPASATAILPAREIPEGIRAFLRRKKVA